MSHPEITYDDDLGLYVDEDGNRYYDTEGKEKYNDDD